MDMDFEEIIQFLVENHLPIDKLKAPSRPGIYGIFLKPSSEFPYVASKNGLLYIGSTGNLSSREYEDHFQSGSSGFSTLRRSFGAILKNTLSLIAIPRGTGNADSNYACYRFTDEGERKLTEWMRNSLEVAILPIDTEHEKIEKELIKKYIPILCIKGCQSPYKEELKVLRKKCADEARLTVK